MRGAFGKGMSQKRIFLIGVLTYGGITFCLFFQNASVARGKVAYEEIVEKEKIVDQDRRAALRAFYAAPPVIPHEVESQDSKDCLRCHLKVTKLDSGRVAMQTPHPQLTSCLQCHVHGLPGGHQDAANTWKGLEEPRRGDRWFWTSPPTVPHRIFMRENCLSCHGPDNPDMRLRTTHPERTQCLQCHVPDYRLDF
jgi:nitrate reductase (cytochrome), electron transfer subunit